MPLLTGQARLSGSHAEFAVQNTRRSATLSSKVNSSAVIHFRALRDANVVKQPPDIRGPKKRRGQPCGFPDPQARETLKRHGPKRKRPLTEKPSSETEPGRTRSKVQPNRLKKSENVRTSMRKRDWYFIAEPPAPAPHLALLNIQRDVLPYALFFDLYLLHAGGRSPSFKDAIVPQDVTVKSPQLTTTASPEQDFVAPTCSPHPQILNRETYTQVPTRNIQS